MAGDAEAAQWIAVARGLIRGDAVRECDRALFETAQPVFGEFLRHLPAGFRDTRPENFILRGRTLVFNDPSGSLPFECEPYLAAKWAPQPAASMKP